MATIKAGYRLHVVDGDGILQGTVELEGYDLDRSLARNAMALAVCDVLSDGAFETESKTEGG